MEGNLNPLLNVKMSYFTRITFSHFSFCSVAAESNLHSNYNCENIVTKSAYKTGYKFNTESKIRISRFRFRLADIIM